MTVKRGLPTDWFKSAKTDQERKAVEEAVRHDTFVLGLLAQIIDEKLSSLDREEMSSASYENPSWAYKQAHVNGHRAGLAQIRQLLNFLEN